MFNIKQILRHTVTDILTGLLAAIRDNPQHKSDIVCIKEENNKLRSEVEELTHRVAALEARPTIKYGAGRNTVTEIHI